MDLEKFYEVVLVLATANALKVEDFAEIGVVLVCDVDQIGLDKGLGRRRLNLEGLEEGFNLRKAGVDALYETRWRGAGEERREASLEGVGIQKHLITSVSFNECHDVSYDSEPTCSAPVSATGLHWKIVAMNTFDISSTTWSANARAYCCLCSSCNSSEHLVCVLDISSPT